MIIWLDPCFIANAIVITFKITASMDNTVLKLNNFTLNFTKTLRTQRSVWKFGTIIDSPKFKSVGILRDFPELNYLLKFQYFQMIVDMNVPAYG